MTGSTPSSVESIPTPITRSMPVACERRNSASRSTSSNPAAGPKARSMSAISRHVAPVSASAAASPSSRPATMSARSWPPARCRAGVKNDSRWTNPWTAPSTTLSYARRAQSSRVISVDCTSQNTREEPVERVVPVQLRRIGGGQLDAVTSRQLHERCGTHRPLDMTVQLHLRQPIQRLRQCHHGRSIAHAVSWYRVVPVGVVG